MKRLESVETILIVVALVSLWPLLVGFNAGWYWVWLTAVLAAMVWVAVRRFRRIRQAAEEAKRKRDEVEKPGPPPFLTG